MPSQFNRFNHLFRSMIIGRTLILNHDKIAEFYKSQEKLHNMQKPMLHVIQKQKLKHINATGCRLILPNPELLRQKGIMSVVFNNSVIYTKLSKLEVTKLYAKYGITVRGFQFITLPYTPFEERPVQDLPVPKGIYRFRHDAEFYHDMPVKHSIPKAA